jgi:hypothetical protein
MRGAKHRASKNNAERPAAMEFFGETAQEGQNEPNSLYAGIETNLALAKHTETRKVEQAVATSGLIT